MSEPVPRFPAHSGLCYDYGWSGPISVLKGLEDLAAGRTKVETFLVADHHKHGERVYRTIEVAKVDRPGFSPFRYCGGKGDPWRPGSRAVDGSSAAEAACSLVAELTNAKALQVNARIFRKPQPNSVPADS